MRLVGGTKTNWFGIALVVLNGIVASIGADPLQFGLNYPHIGAWLSLAALAIGLLLKELPSSMQANENANLKTQISDLKEEKAE